MAEAGYELQKLDGTKIEEDSSIEYLLVGGATSGIQDLQITNFTLKKDDGSFVSNAAIHLDFIDEDSQQTLLSVTYNVYPSTIDIFSKFGDSWLPYNTPVQIKVYHILKPDGVYDIIPVKLIKLTDKQLLFPDIIFPTISDKLPYTQITLPQVERFGFEFNDEALGMGAETFGLSFYDITTATSTGVKTYHSQLDVAMNNTSYDYYFSETTLTKSHIIFNIGKFIDDNNIYQEKIRIQSFYKMKYSGETIHSESYYIDSSEYNIWTRPGDIKGNLLHYHDYNNFMLFIRKYKSLNPNFESNLQNLGIDLKPPKQGEVIKTKFWQGIAEQLKIFASNMSETWGKSALAWKIDVDFRPNDYYKGLSYSGSHFEVAEGKTTGRTYNYFHNYGFSYDALSVYTYNDLAGVVNDNNLTQNYFDLLNNLNQDKE